VKLVKRVEITDIDGRNVYLRRWTLRLPFGRKLMLHHILRPDADRCQHDHPWGFVTLVLWGGYVELVGEAQRMQRMRPGRAGWRPPEYRHRIITLPRGHAWTLVLTTRRTGSWGFYTRDGWMHWRQFVNAARSARVLWCHDGTRRGDEPRKGSE